MTKFQRDALEQPHSQRGMEQCTTGKPEVRMVRCEDCGCEHNAIFNCPDCRDRAQRYLESNRDWLG